MHCAALRLCSGWIFNCRLAYCLGGYGTLIFAVFIETLTSSKTCDNLKTILKVSRKTEQSNVSPSRELEGHFSQALESGEKMRRRKMSLKKMVILSGLAIGIMATTQIVFAEEAAVAPADPAGITANQQVSLPKDSDMQWAWGEVTNLDNQAKTVTLKYLDYETDQEKDLVLTVDAKTTFENIKGFDELKLKDTLSVDYAVGLDNNNIAKNISFEKPDVSSSAPVSAVENSQPLTPPSGTGQPVVDTAAQPVVPAQPAAQSETSVDSSAAVNESPAPAAPAAPAESASAVQGQAQ